MKRILGMSQPRGLILKSLHNAKLPVKTTGIESGGKMQDHAAGQLVLDNSALCWPPKGQHPLKIAVSSAYQEAVVEELFANTD